MARTIRAVGFPAVSQALQILARNGVQPFTVVPRTVVLEPTAVWNGDSIIVSAAARAVEYACGDTLYEEETLSFLANTYSTGSKRLAWMSGLSPAASQYAFRMAESLLPWWGPRGSLCAWLQGFGAFYSSQLAVIETAGRHASMMLEGLFGLRARWPGVFRSLVPSMGECAAEVFSQWVGQNDAARLLGILVGARGASEISVAGLARAIAALRESPTEEFGQCMAAPHYAGLVRRAGSAAGNLEPVIAKLRAGLR